MTRYGRMTEEEADYERKVRRERIAEAEEKKASGSTTRPVPASATSQSPSKTKG